MHVTATLESACYLLRPVYTNCMEVLVATGDATKKYYNASNSKRVYTVRIPQIGSAVVSESEHHERPDCQYIMKIGMRPPSHEII